MTQLKKLGFEKGENLFGKANNLKMEANIIDKFSEASELQLTLFVIFMIQFQFLNPFS